MCGIYGIVGKTSTSHLIDKLSLLEYRGYDSCGVAYIYKNKSYLFKTVGNTDNLRNNIPALKISTAIGHTRWATHGNVSPINAHPHTTSNNRFFVIHNGMIDNYKELIVKYSFDMISDTDSEIIAHLLDYYSNSLSNIECIKQISLEIKGSYACVILDKKENNKLFFIKNKSPLLIATDGEKVELSSDQIAFDNKMNVTILNDNNYGFIDEKNYHIFSFNYAEKWNTFYKDYSFFEFSKSNHFMLDEIYYQPSMILNVASNYRDIDISNLQKLISKSSEIVFIGAGSSYYASLILKTYYERKINKRCYAVLASEISSFLVMTRDTLFIILSQSGETADILEAVRLLKTNYKIVSLCNKTNSQLGFNSDIVFPLFAGDEIAVASTKAFMAMIYVGKLLLDPIYYIGNSKTISKELNVTLSLWNKIYEVSKKVASANCVFYIGKDVDSYISCEAGLKLREISYLHTFAFPSGELKHGSISLIDENSVCLGIVTSPALIEKVKNNLIEVESRKAKTYLISNIDTKADIYVSGGELSIIMVVQIIAYQVAKLLNRNIDQPRNLAKSVTVL